MAKMARERALQERRALKQQKKDERKQAKAAGGMLPGDGPEGETPGDEQLASSLPQTAPSVDADR